MRILHVTDLHANDAQFGWVVRQNKNFDLVCITGDFLDLNAYRPIGDQLGRVTHHLTQITTPLALCSGNHDSLPGAGDVFHEAQWLRGLKRTNVWVDDDGFDLRGFKFRCIPWMGQFVDPDASEIWLIHSPPDLAPTGIVRGGAGFGDFDFGELCRSGEGPKLSLSGHVHDPQHWRCRVKNTWSLNPGHPGGTSAVPNHIVIDLNRGIATHHRANGETDIVRLWASHLTS